jgi:peptidoglycan/LPS O-acetylase OafA/YrhL
MVDLLKAVAAQVILWHHFCRYGPLARTIELAGHEWVAFIGNHGRHAVQVFLVLSGFLAAHSVRTFLTHSSLTDLTVSLSRAWLGRAWRLGIPYWLMLLFAIAIAALARQIQPDIDTPTVPQWWQVVAHFLFLQDIFESDALSTGVWYVAVDLQLSALFLILVFASSVFTARVAKSNPVDSNALLSNALLSNAITAERVLTVAVWLLMLMALFGFNRWRSLDSWAIYFFGSFGLGLTVGLHCLQGHKKAVLFWLALVSSFAIAMSIEWRPGLLVALVTAALLWWSNSYPIGVLDPKYSVQKWVKHLGRDSYALFLFHYPIVMLLGTIVDLYWPEQGVPAVLGLVLCWGVSMLVAFGVTRAFTMQKKAPKPLQESI